MDELADIAVGAAKPTSYVKQVFCILRLFAEGSETLGVKEISEQLTLPPSSMRRILEPLMQLGLVERAPLRRYRVGTELFCIAARIENRFELIEMLVKLHSRYLSRLLGYSGWTSALSGKLKPPRVPAAPIPTRNTPTILISE